MTWNGKDGEQVEARGHLDAGKLRVDTVGKVILFAVYAVRNECIQPSVCFTKFEVN